MKHSPEYPASQLTLGTLQIDFAARKVFVLDELHLTEMEYATLELLLRHRGTAVTKEFCVQRLYGGTEKPDAKIIAVYVHALRKKLANIGAGDLIETVLGHGYMIREPEPPPMSPSASVDQPAMLPVN